MTNRRLAEIIRELRGNLQAIDGSIEEMVRLARMRRGPGRPRKSLRRARRLSRGPAKR